MYMSVSVHGRMCKATLILVLLRKKKLNVCAKKSCLFIFGGAQERGIERAISGIRWGKKFCRTAGTQTQAVRWSQEIFASKNFTALLTSRRLLLSQLCLLPTFFMQQHFNLKKFPSTLFWQFARARGHDWQKWIKSKIKNTVVVPDDTHSFAINAFVESK